MCTIHPNAKLQMAALKKLHDYDSTMLMSKIVCSTSSMMCMLHRCDNCPGKENLKAFLEECIGLDTDVAVDPEEAVTYAQWVHTDRTTLVTHEEPLAQYLETLCDKLNTLTARHFIAKAQSAFLKKEKENLAPGLCIVLCDFAENYSFIAQDAAQGFH